MVFATNVRANEDSKSDDQKQQNQSEASKQEKASQQDTAQSKQEAQEDAKQNQDKAQTEEQKNARQSEQSRQSSDQEHNQSNEQNRQSQSQHDQTPNKENTSSEQSSQQRHESQHNTNRAAEDRGQNQRGRGSLGVSIVRSDEGNGVTVMQIMPNTAAERMGLKRRDRITSLNGEPVRSVDDFISEIRNMSPGDSVELKVTRNGDQRTVRGELAGYSDSVVETQGPSGTRAYRQFRSYIAPERSNSQNERSGREGYARDSRENVQTSYNDRGESGRMQSGELESRISRIEQQLDRLSEQVNRLTSQGQPQSAQRNATPDGEKR
jgi:hypothetical protein